MKKKSGFIATSLIYSFFLVFISIIMALVSNYISNKTIMSRFNETIMENLNEPPYTITIYADKSLTSSTNQIKTGTITNLLKNGNFVSNLDYWTKVGTISASAASDSLVIESANANSYIQQTSGLALKADHLYYIAGYYFQPFLETQLDIGFNGDNNITKTKKTTSNDINQIEWVKISKLYKPVNDETKAFIIGKSSSAYSNFVRFKDLIVIDVTNDFNFLTSESWLNNNIIYFDDTLYYLIKDNISSLENVTITLTNYTISNITCSNTNGEIAVSKSISGTNSIITINQVRGDVKCVVKSV